MRVYQYNKEGYCAEISTSGGYKPIGWHTTKTNEYRFRNKGNR